MLLALDEDAQLDGAFEAGAAGAAAKLAAQPLQQKGRVQDPRHADLAPFRPQAAATTPERDEEIVPEAVRRGAQADAVIIALDRVAAGMSQQLDRRLAPPGAVINSISRWPFNTA